MIILEDVYKRYIVDKVPGKWILEGVSLAIPPKARVGLVGSKGSGKSTLLRLIAGAESPTEGRIVRKLRVATPTSYMHSFQPLLTARQNARFICRINGYADELEDRLSRIDKLAGLGAKFDKPVSTYTPPMKSSLSFALSMALDFDIYISDGINFAAETAFKNKEAADAALMKLTEHSGIIMTTQGALGEATLMRYCAAGIWLHEGKAQWFDDINDAIEAHRAKQSSARLEGESQQTLPNTEQVQPIIAKIKKMQNSLAVLSKGLKGSPVSASEKEIFWLIQFAKEVGMELATAEQISGRGYRVREGMIPILQGSDTAGDRIEYYDLGSQCDKILPIE